MAKRLLSHPKITILWNTIAVECLGDGDLLNGLRIRHVHTGEENDLPISGLFYAVGHEPATQLIRGQLQTYPDGYIVTVPGTTQTSVRGVFAAGDCAQQRGLPAPTGFLATGSGDAQRAAVWIETALFMASLGAGWPGEAPEGPA